MIFYDSPKRVAKTLAILSDIMPDRAVALVREISKLYEEVFRMKAGNLADHIADNPVKGEIALVIHGNTSAEASADNGDLEKRIGEEFAKGRSVKDISVLLAMETGLKKKDIYERALDIKQNNTL